MMGEWREKYLNEIITLEYGEGLPQEKRKYGDYPIYGSNGIVDFHIDFLVKGPGIIVGRKGSIGEICWSESNFWPIDTTYYVQPKYDVDLKWLYYKLKTLGLQKLNSASGTPGLNRNDAYNIKILMPSNIFEQSKIAEILTTIDDAIEKTEKIIAKYKRIKRGLMQDLLTKGIDENGNIRSEATHKFKGSPLGRIPVEWNVCRMDEIATIIMGQSPDGNTYNQEEKGIALINGPTEFDRRYPFKIQWTTSPTKVCKKGDILLCVRGSTTGRINIANDIYCIGRGVAAIRGKDSKIKTQLLEIYLLDLAVGILSEAKGNGSTFPSIKSDRLKSQLVKIMNNREQEQIVSLIDNTESIIAKEDDFLNKLIRIKRGLMNDLLTGKVRVTHLLDKGGKLGEYHT